MRVIAAHDRADRRRRLLVWAAGLETVLVHPVEDAAVNRLQTVADVRQRAADDDRHGVVEEARPHFLVELARLDASAGKRTVREQIRHPGSARRSRSAR